ncbi:HlyD family efflux transporter periplasmic adaptor subunit [Verrucomicrobiales bacterium BCK34]|nr:HlyD family efflux transporter periplasmic adaptor subunit [Verrucomicrobiales bacterium BCK34]
MSVDHRISEISTSRPRLRRDVRTHYQEYRGEPSYIVEDTSKGKFFHVGFPEHQFIQCFDGRTTISQALARNAATQGEEALTEQQGDQLLRWLVDNDLLESDTSGQGERRMEQWSKQQDKKPKNPISKVMFFKVPLGCPDRFIGSTKHLFGWIFGVPGLLMWLALVLYTCFQLAPHWDQFVKATGQVIAPGNWIRVILIYTVLKVLHEYGHGLATKRYGGAVPEWGVQLLAFVTPLAFVDASASWKFPSKWKRIIVSAAGMYVEVAIACFCLLGWLHTDPGVLNTSLHSAVIAATFVTLLFNANPLMRFDGYYILLDALGIPNLGTKGQQFLVWVGKRVFLGMEDLPMPIAARQHPVAVPLYGVLAAIWKILIWIGIMIIVSLLFKGAGLFLALASVAVMVGASAVKFFKFLFKSGSGPKLSRALPRLGITVLLLLGVFWFARINPTGKALAVVEYAEREVIRAGVRGKVTEVLVEQDDVVKEGDLLLTLSNPDEEAERDKLVLELRTARIRARSYYQQENLPAHQAELETITGLERKLEESRQYLAALEVVAPKDGVIAGRQLKTLEGQWLNTGDEILSVIAGNERELLISFRQEDVESVISQKSPEIKVRLRGRSKTIEAVIERIESRATRALPHEVMSASSGGPLALRTSSDPVAERERDIARGGGEYDSDLDYFSGLGDRQPGRELARARFAGRAKITDAGDQELREGEWGYLRFANAEKERLGKWLYNEVSTYVKEKIEQARAAAS